MKIESVYDNSGNHLGDEYVDLSGLQEDTKLAVVHLLFLDECVDIVVNDNKKATKR